MPKIRTMGATHGRCNICGEHRKLTEDHIPPKGASRLKQATMMNLLQRLRVQFPDKSERHTQDGVKYRTICGECNNDRLGAQMDPVLIHFAAEIRRYLESPLALAPSFSVPTQPNKLARCVVGHLLAYGLDQHRPGSMGSALTDYFLDTNARFPANIAFYCWLYPLNDQIIVKGAGRTHGVLDEFAVFYLLKFYPLAFCLFVDQPASWQVHALQLNRYLGDDLEATSELHFSPYRQPPPSWPEHPGEHGVVLYGNEAIAAVAHQKKRG